MASKLVIIIVFILDLIAVGLAIAAEQRRSVVSISLLFLALFQILLLLFVVNFGNETVELCFFLVILS